MRGLSFVFIEKEKLHSELRRFIIRGKGLDRITSAVPSPVHRYPSEFVIPYGSRDTRLLKRTTLSAADLDQ